MNGEDYAPRSVSRVPPHSREAEESLLGAVLLSPDAANEVMDRIHPEDFYVPAHQSIFEAMRRLYDENQSIDAVTLSEELRRSGELDKVGGVSYLTRLVDVVPVTSNVEHYADIVDENARRRDLIRAGATVTTIAFDLDDEIHSVMDRAEQSVLSVAERRASQNMIEVGPLFSSVLEQIEALEEQGSEVTGLATGFRDLDKKLAGLQNANLVIIAARPAMGKCLAGDTMLTEAVTGERFTLEELVGDAEKRRGVRLHALDEATGKLVVVSPSDFLDQGEQDVVKLTTRLGRQITATPNHPLLTINGWRKLEELGIGDEIAVPRSLGSDVTWDPIVSIEPAGRRRVYDLTIPEHANFVANDIVVHNSALMMNIATNVATHGAPVALFSLEMSKEEIVQRILSSVGRVDSMKLRSGQLGPLWQRVVDAASRMYQSPIYIDDSPVVTVTDIRAKCRRLKRKVGLSLVIVDYLQLMQGSARENRQQEIAEISRNLKNLARELDVPVIGLSQLNRSLEAREDKRPRLSDLRESGCMPANTRLLRADTGTEVTLGELVRSQEHPLVWSVDDQWRLVPKKLTNAFRSGIKPVFRLRTAAGYEVEATANHRFLTVDGWQRLDSLHDDSHIAVPRSVPAPVGSRAGWEEDELVGCHGKGGEVVPGALLEGVQANPDVDVVPWEVAERVKESAAAYPLGSKTRPRGFSRDRLRRMGEILGDETIVDPATSDVVWDQIVEIAPVGEMPTFDATVEETHNFIANGVVAHNSLEQDADVVMFIYRHEYYHPEDQENKGLAEVIVAKHRAGATGTVRMTFLPEFTRFADLGRDVT